MVGKLLKHELWALFRILFCVAIAVVGFAILSRILFAVRLTASSAGENSMLFEIAQIVSLLFYMFAIVSFVFVAFGLGVHRFYRTMFTGEGYMTFSIPATPMQIVWAKLIAAILGILFAYVVSFASLCIFAIGWQADVMEGIASLFQNVFTTLGDDIRAAPLLFAENAILSAVTLPSLLLLSYALLSVGQLFTSHRKLMCFVLALAFIFGLSFLETLLVDPVVYTLLRAVPAAVAEHLAVWLDILGALLTDVICIFVVRYILRNKVNLVA